MTLAHSRAITTTRVHRLQVTSEKQKGKFRPLKVEKICKLIASQLLANKNPIKMASVLGYIQNDQQQATRVVTPLASAQSFKWAK